MVVGMGQGLQAQSLSHFADADIVTRKIATHHDSTVRSVGRDQDSAARMSLACITSLWEQRAQQRPGQPLAGHSPGAPLYSGSVPGKA